MNLHPAAPVVVIEGSVRPFGDGQVLVVAQPKCDRKMHDQGVIRGYTHGSFRR
jgi:hypothetical protein